MPSNRAPIAKILGPTSVLLGKITEIDASGSTDPDGTIRKWGVDWGDGDHAKFIGKPGQAEHQYAAAGKYKIVLTVYDNKQSVGSAKHVVEVVDEMHPAPVDCVLSAWSPWTAFSPWASNGDGTESRTRSRTRTVVTEPAYGGAACGPLSEADTETRDIPAPAPVDCVLSAWAFQSATPWGACRPDGTQTRTETWTRTVVTEPAHGGAACGRLSEERTASQACVYVPPAPPPPPGGHPHFERVAALPECVAHWSLRDQAQLDGLVNASPSRYFTYAPSLDAYSTPQDGAKFFKPVDDRLGQGSDSIPGNQQLKMPIGINTGSVIIGWEFWYGEEFRRHTRAGDPLSGLANYKTFQVRQGVSGRWWTSKNRFNLAGADPEVSHAGASIDIGSAPRPPGNQLNDPTVPTGAGAASRETFPIYHSRWTRYWIEIRLNRPAEEFAEWKALNVVGPTGNSADLVGTWHMCSMWIADPGRPATRVLFRVPWQMGGGNHNDTIGSFDFEFNTSAQPPPTQTGPLVGYGRNVYVLHDYALPLVNPESDLALFARP